MAYDETNIFAAILSGKIPCNKVFENEYALAFHDIMPQMPVHVLVIPKGAYTNMDEFSRLASAEEQAGFIRAIGEAARIVGVDDSGYRLISNNGPDAYQEVAHLHVHIFGGKKVPGRMIKRED